VTGTPRVEIAVELLRTRDDLSFLETLRGQGPIALVPTMGALHDGHLSLVETARQHGAVVVSIFVNPTQFGPGEDFNGYPRDLARDLELLAPHSVAAVFAPDIALVYPQGPGVTVQPGRRAAPLCGAARPGHFAGVLTIVAKLLHLVGPQAAVFGRKDAQQLLVIAEMVRDLHFPVELIEGPTVREEDGLALSSRNRFLAAAERKRAACLYRALQLARASLADGPRPAADVVEKLRAGLRPADRIDYAEVRSLPDLEPADPVTGRVLLAVAAQVGPARLIDNLVLDVAEGGVRSACLLRTSWEG
jgi:pantoate--beta-alanine ligase